MDARSRGLDSILDTPRPLAWLLFLLPLLLWMASLGTPPAAAWALYPGARPAVEAGLRVGPGVGLPGPGTTLPGRSAPGGVPDPTDFDRAYHIANEVDLVVTNQGVIGNSVLTGGGHGFWPMGTSNNYVFGTGLWIGGIADIDGSGSLDTVFVQGYNPMAGDAEFVEGRVGQDPADPLARVFDSFDPFDLLDWPLEFGRIDPGTGDTIPELFSSQDLATIYNGVPGSPVFGIGNLPLQVQQRSMAFQGDDIGQVIYIVFDITNRSADTPEGPYAIEDAWLGYDSDMDIGDNFADDLTSILFDQVNVPDTVALDMGIAWDSDFREFNFTGIPGFVGVVMLQAPGDPDDGIDNDGDGIVDESPWNGIDDDNDGDIDEPDEADELGLVNFSMHCGGSIPCPVLDPQTDAQGYDILACDTPGSGVDCFETTGPNDVRFMVSSGPFDWPPGATVRFAIALVFAEPVGSPNSLDFVGDPPRPDPNDPVLARLVEVTRTAREFWANGFAGYRVPLDIVGTTPLADTNDPTAPREILTNVVDSVGIHAVSLFHAEDGGDFAETLMTPGGVFSHRGEIPAAPFGTTVSYFVQAVDSLFAVARDPDDAPLTTFGYEVIDAPTFTDLTSGSGIEVLGGNARTAVWFDQDGDGDEDLYVGSTSRSYLYRNEGEITFTDVTEAAGISANLVMAAQAADYDGDGDADLYVVRNVDTNLLYRNDGDGSFTDVSAPAGVDFGAGSRGALWGDVDRDGLLDLLLYGSIGQEFTPVLYHNRGDGTFEDATAESGLTGIEASLANAAALFDRNGDGDLDLYLVTNGANVLFDNLGDGTFADRTLESGLGDDGNGTALAVGDTDADGDLDLFVGAALANRLYRNDGDGTFTAVSPGEALEAAGIEEALFADVNLDGYPDLLTGRAALWMNGRAGTFTERAEFAGIERFGAFVTAVDLDGDGWLGPYNSRLYRNDGYPFAIGRNALAVRLQGTRGPRDDVGATVVAVAGGLRHAALYGDVAGGSMGSRPVEFGVDTSAVVDSLVVHWSSGAVQFLTDVAVNQEILVVEDSTLVGIGDGGDGAPGLPRAFALSQNYPNPFNPSTTIRYDIPAGAGGISHGSGGEVVGGGSDGTDDRSSRGLVPVRLLIYDLRGRLVRTLVDREQPPSRYAAHWDGRDDRGAQVGSGVYIYRLQAGAFVETRKMVMVR